MAKILAFVSATNTKKEIVGEEKKIDVGSFEARGKVIDKD
jgi:hypothetical protein